MAVASSEMPIQQLMGSTYSAGFDLTSRTPIDGRLSVQTLADLTNEKTWRSRSQKDDQHPEYWLYNGMITSVVETGKIYVLVEIDESQPATVWPNPTGPGEATEGPRWVEVGSAGDIQTLTIQANGQPVMEFDGNQAKTLNFVGTNVNIEPDPQKPDTVNVNLVWQDIVPQ